MSYLVSSCLNQTIFLSPASSLFSSSKTLSGLYCLIIISIYLSVTVNKLTHSNLTVPEVEVEFLMCYLYSFSSMFLLYILLYLARIPTSFDNIKSHGSGFLRQGFSSKIPC